jgi:hypothetical protein
MEPMPSTTPSCAGRAADACMPSCSVTRPQPRPRQAKPVVGRGWGFCHRCARLVALLLVVVGPALVGLGYAVHRRPEFAQSGRYGHRRCRCPHRLPPGRGLVTSRGRTWSGRPRGVVGGWWLKLFWHGGAHPCGAGPDIALVTEGAGVVTVVADPTLLTGGSHARDRAGLAGRGAHWSVGGMRFWRG